VDILTQGLLGAVFAQVIANKEEKKLASIAGAAAGLLADADILIRSSSDPLLTLEYHRHFSHSLFFIPFGAAIAMLLLWPLMRRRLSLRRLYIFCLAGYSLSGLLDACTSYGTYLFWPLSNERVALNIISIVDPIFTLSLFNSPDREPDFKREKICYSWSVLLFDLSIFGIYAVKAGGIFCPSTHD
jgi:inner membrane protein